jgi:hypothetical protein
VTFGGLDDNVDIGIHRKPTVTDGIISLESCHPYEQKTMAIRFLAGRLVTYRLSNANKEKKKIIKHILKTTQYESVR